MGDLNSLPVLRAGEPLEEALPSGPYALRRQPLSLGAYPSSCKQPIDDISREACTGGVMHACIHIH